MKEDHYNCIGPCIHPFQLSLKLPHMVSDPESPHMVSDPESPYMVSDPESPYMVSDPESNADKQTSVGFNTILHGTVRPARCGNHTLLKGSLVLI